MEITTEAGPNARVAVYHVPDGELAAGSTLGGPRACAVVKATGAIEKVYSIDLGENIFGTLVVHHWDERTGLHLDAEGGTFTLHPEHQERNFNLANDVHVHEDIFVLSGQPGEDGTVDPPAVYYTVGLRNDSHEEARIATYAFCQLRGRLAEDVVVRYDGGTCALISWKESRPEHARIWGCSERPASYEASLDYAKGVAEDYPALLSNSTETPPGDPLGILHHSHTLQPGESVSFYYLLSMSDQGQEGAIATYMRCPDAEEALRRTTGYYHEMLSRAVVLTPNPQVNRGALWAKANMLRVMLKAPTGWCFTNNPTNSNNAVARDTAWFAYGADYVAPQFARESLLAFVERQEESGMIVESYNILDGTTNDLGLNINDDTPLLILGLWHYYSTSGDEAFLRRVYPAAVKAARYILSQRNAQGLVWCTATGTGGKGVLGWRNAMQDYRLSGATTEVNSECYAALESVARMARTLGKDAESAAFAGHAAALKEAINAHLYNPGNGLYYLNIDVDGQPRSNVTSDLVFPVIFGVASEETAVRIIRRLSQPDFWTAAGMRVVPRDAPFYSPDLDAGLRGGVWVGVTFWYAYAVASYAPQFLGQALGASFANYSHNPHQNNTVPGQYSEWLHGETLHNEGMMLSPWFPPRYLWAAIEGMVGLDRDADELRVEPRLAPNWTWLGVQNLPYRGRYLTWVAVRMPDLHIYSNATLAGPVPCTVYADDISRLVTAGSGDACVVALRNGDDLLLFVGNTNEQAIATSLRVDDEVLSGSYRRRGYDSLAKRWIEEDGLLSADRLREGITLQVERQGYCLLDLRHDA